MSELLCPFCNKNLKTQKYSSAFGVGGNFYCVNKECEFKTMSYHTERQYVIVKNVILHARQHKIAQERTEQPQG